MSFIEWNICKSAKVFFSYFLNCKYFWKTTCNVDNELKCYFLWNGSNEKYPRKSIIQSGWILNCSTRTHTQYTQAQDLEKSNLRLLSDVRFNESVAENLKNRFASTNQLTFIWVETLTWMIHSHLILLSAAASFIAIARCFEFPFYHLSIVFFPSIYFFFFDE